MAKGLFTNLEEIKFHYDYVQGHVKPVRDPNVGQNPAKVKLCAQKQRKISPRSQFFKTR